MNSYPFLHLSFSVLVGGRRWWCLPITFRLTWWTCRVSAEILSFVFSARTITAGCRVVACLSTNRRLETSHLSYRTHLYYIDPDHITPLHIPTVTHHTIQTTSLNIWRFPPLCVWRAVGWGRWSLGRPGQVGLEGGRPGWVGPESGRPDWVGLGSWRPGWVGLGSERGSSQRHAVDRWADHNTLPLNQSRAGVFNGNESSAAYYIIWCVYTLCVHINFPHYNGYFYSWMLNLITPVISRYLIQNLLQFELLNNSERQRENDWKRVQK